MYIIELVKNVASSDMPDYRFRIIAQKLDKNSLNRFCNSGKH